MNTFDLVVVIVLLAGAIVGAFKGFVKCAIGMAVVLLGAWLGMRYGNQLALMVAAQMEWTLPAARLTTFGVLFLILMLLSWFTVFILEKAIKAAHFGFVNRLGGAAFNMLKYAVFVCLITGLLHTLQARKQVLPEKLIAGSVSFGPLGKAGHWLFTSFLSNF